jgi:hypothetical protein
MASVVLHAGGGAQSSFTRQQSEHVTYFISPSQLLLLQPCTRFPDSIWYPTQSSRPVRYLDSNFCPVERIRATYYLGISTDPIQGKAYVLSASTLITTHYSRPPYNRPPYNRPPYNRPSYTRPPYYAYVTPLCALAPFSLPHIRSDHLRVSDVLSPRAALHPPTRTAATARTTTHAMTPLESSMFTFTMVTNLTLIGINSFNIWTVYRYNKKRQMTEDRIIAQCR